MSTLKLESLQHPDSANENIILNADGSVGGELATTLASKADYPSGGTDGQALIKSGMTTAWGSAGGGKILQVVEGTDASQRSTTSTSFVDVTGVSVTITPSSASSKVMVIVTGAALALWNAESLNAQYAEYIITDSSNNNLTGNNGVRIGGTALVGRNLYNKVIFTPLFLIDLDAPATTSAVTYKLRFKSTTSVTAYVDGNYATTRMYAIEVGA